MWSVDEPGSLDDYEFSSDLGLRRFYRERKAFDRAEWHADTLQRKAKDLLERVDRSGVWTVGTTFGAIAISALDSLFDFGDARAVTLQQILPAWVPDVPTLFGVLIDPATVDSAENTLQAVFLFEFVLRAWSERFSPAYLRSPVALVDLAAVIPSVTNLLGGLGGETATAALRPLRLFRLLRLLRLKEQNRARDPYNDDDSVANSSGKMTDKVANVAVEFLCVFLIAGELFYDIEFEVNPNISDVGDALYWSFLTLTGIGQPFEAVTAAGRVATVGSILTALVVVPLQLANLVSESGRAGGAGGGGGRGGAGGGLGLGGGVVSEDGIRVVARGVGVGRSIGAPIASARNMTGEGIRRDFDDRGDFDARGAFFALDAGGTSEPPRSRSVDPRDLGPMDTVDFEEARIDAAGEDVIGRERERTRAEMDSAFASFDEGSAYEYSPRERARAGPGPGPGGEEAPERFDEEAPGRSFDEEAPERRFDEEAPETRFDASAATRAELRAARARLRAFEREVDALRDENARLARALASVVARNENVRAEADDGVDAGSNPGGADADARSNPRAAAAAPAAAAVAREKERVDERS